jgi:3-oxoadipyl-CoA thiolase
MTDAFICAYRRTPIGRYGGALASVRPDDLAAHAIAAALAQTPGLDPAAVDEVIFGCANQAGEDNRNVARMALLLAGVPETTPGVTVNRLCASGLEAVAQAARAIRCGEAQVVVAGGVESMTRAPFVTAKATAPFARSMESFDTTIGWRFVNPIMQARFGTDSMPETAENVAEEHRIDRASCDAFALRSQQRTAASADWRTGEIAAVEVRKGKAIVSVADDEHPRADTTVESLAALRPIVRPDGVVTAGNASGVNDGAAAVVIASTAAVKRFGLTPLARIVGAAAAGVAPRVMGIGPTPALARLLALTGWSLDDVGHIELNEAFAAQALAVTRALGLADDDERVNPDGGAIALGHPLGMSGARIAGAAARSIAAGRARKAIATMCVGVGQGAALALEAV